MGSVCAHGGYALLTTVLYEHFMDLCLNLYFLCSFFTDIIVQCSFYSVCNTDTSDVCAIKITCLLTYLLTLYTPSLHVCLQSFSPREAMLARSWGS